MYLQNKSEFGVIFNLLITNLNSPAFLDGESPQQGVQNWVDRLSNVLEQKEITIGHCPLDGIQIATRISA